MFVAALLSSSRAWSCKEDVKEERMREGSNGVMWKWQGATIQ
jgi:hypothetical protein